jgi:hypothetical protein
VSAFRPDLWIDGAIIATVDIHGRDRLARPLICLLLFVLARGPLLAQTAAPSPFHDLRVELAEKIAAIVGSQPVVVSAPGDDADGVADLDALLRARGVRLADRAAGATSIAVSCAVNVRDRACIAEITKDGGSREVVAATRPLTASAAAVRPPALALDARPLFAQRTPILDVAATPDGKRLIVLEPSAVALRQWTPAGGVSDVVDSRPVQTARVWPRDLRGRVNAAQIPFDVFLPGVTCRGDVDPLRVSCADETAPWPGLPNGGVEAARNYFTTPEGRTFVSAAAVAGETSARWLIADPQGALTLLDEKRSTIAKLAAAGDDVAGVRASCAAGPFVVVSNRVIGREADAGDVDELRLYRVAGRELVPSASPLRLPGTLTALWSATSLLGSIDSPASCAIAVVHDGIADRYEAFHISVSCAR